MKVSNLYGGNLFIAKDLVTVTTVSTSNKHEIKTTLTPFWACISYIQMLSKIMCLRCFKIEEDEEDENSIQLIYSVPAITYRGTIRRAGTRSMPLRHIVHWSASQFHSLYQSLISRVSHMLLSHWIAEDQEYMLYSLALVE